MHKHRVLLRMRHQRLIDLVRLEDGRTLCGFVLEAHAGADVRVDRIRACDCLDRVLHQGDAAARLLADFDRLVDDLKLGREALGSGNGAMYAELRSRQHQRVAYVIAIANVGEAQAFRRAKAFLQREEIGDRLAGVFQIGECVDDRDA